MKNAFFIIIACFFLLSCKKNDIIVDFENIKDSLVITLLAENNKTIIYENSKKNQIPNEYGENDWHLKYNDSLCCSFRHFKTNANNKHDYLFKIVKKNNDYFCNIEIIGENPIKQTIKLTKCNNF
jgi:hypothetical protein